MFTALKKILGLGPPVDYKNLIENGAQIIDVRTRGEYASGHIIGSVNIPLNELQANLKKINLEKAVITCCASGVRSASAKAMLQGMGVKQVYNGGGWMSLNSKLSQ